MPAIVFIHHEKWTSDELSVPLDERESYTSYKLNKNDRPAALTQPNIYQANSPERQRERYTKLKSPMSTSGKV